MIEDRLRSKITEREEREKFHKKKVDELYKIVKKAIPTWWSWAVYKKYDEKGYYLEINRGFFVQIVVGSIVSLGDPDVEAEFNGEFKLKPLLNRDGEMAGISMYPTDQTYGYNMARKFTEKFNKEYDGRYKLIIDSP